MASPRKVIAVAATLVVAATVYLGAFGWSRGSAQAPTPALATALVVRATVRTQQLVPGTLGFATNPTTLPAAAAGVVQWVPNEAAILHRGAVVYRLAGAPVVLLYGRGAVWRTLVAGMTGPDVRLLNANLASLRKLPRALATSNEYGPSTEQAVRRLQAATGADVTGIVQPGWLLYAPGPMRVQTVSVAAGEPVGPQTNVLTMASATRVVSVSLDAASQDEVRAGDAVEIQLPNGTQTQGLVADVSHVAASPTDSGNSSGTSSDSSGDTNAAVAVTVRLRDQRAAAGLDQAPVQVAITTAEARNVLAVPVAALLAQGPGGYAVQIVRPGRAGVVTAPVTTGLFSDTSDLVEITSGNLRVGDRVVMPS